MSSRFYTPDGTCITGLREARKLSPLPLPSVSTVLSLLIPPGLVRYFKWQMFKAAISIEERPEWSEDDHYAACLSKSEVHGQQARDAGTELHDLIQGYNLARKHQKPLPSPPERWAGQYRSYVGWYETNVAESLAVEEVLFGEGYAGRVDHVCLLMGGRIAVVDAKSQNLTNKKKFNHYLSWAMQLGAYCGAYQTPIEVDPIYSSSRPQRTLISLVFDPNGSAFEAYEWPEPPEHYLDLFLGLAAIWRSEHHYFPSENGTLSEEQFDDIPHRNQA